MNIKELADLKAKLYEDYPDQSSRMIVDHLVEDALMTGYRQGYKQCLDDQDREDLRAVAFERDFYRAKALKNG